MTIPLLFALPADLQVQDLLIESEILTLVLASSQEHASCPDCASTSLRVHSRYRRTLADLPCQGRTVRWWLTVRRFFCENPACSRKTFVEQVPDVAPAYARRTLRQKKTLCEIAFALGGRPGARLAHFLGLPVSFWTLLRFLRQVPPPPVQTPLILGVDDFAWRKGNRYGTILVDLQAHQPIDLLPDREASTFTAWLRSHPGVEVISRDRAGAYADGAKQGAPDAVQVADRYHLVANLRETLQRLLDRKRSCLPFLEENRSAAPSEPTLDMVPREHEGERKDIQRDVEEKVPLTRAELTRQVRRSKRFERYQAVVNLHQQGMGVRAITRQLGISRNTVRRYLQAETFPEQGLRRKRPSRLDPYLPYVRKRWEAGCQNAAQLYRELKDRGYRGSHTLLRSLLSDWRANSPMTARRTPGAKRKAPALGMRRLSSRQASFLFVKQPDALTPAQQHALEHICQSSDEMKMTYALSQQFISMLRMRQAEQLDGWLERLKEPGSRELSSFASGIKRDDKAVRAAASRPESNGQVEGQNTRVKLLKRQMYGRAKFDLLRLRVLHVA